MTKKEYKLMSFDKDSFPTIDKIAKPILTTNEAAFLLNRQPQTLRSWAMASMTKAPIKPINVGGRLGWKLSEIKKLLGVD